MSPKMSPTSYIKEKASTQISVLTWCYVVEMMGFEPTTPTLRT